MKKTIQKAWKFLADDDSPLSWFLNLLIAFVVIKYLVFPGLGLIFATTHPVVAVVSGSMEHGLAEGVVCGVRPDAFSPGFDGWWEVCGDFYTDLNISKEDFMEFSFPNGFNTGDIIVLSGKKPSEIMVGDVIVFQGNRPDPIIHRVVARREEGKYFFQTKGDHNPYSDSYEKNIGEERVIGRAFFRIPYLGYIKIWAVDLLSLIGLKLL